jgi:peptidyl-prolyl cis-trans isomerase SurA
MREYLLVWVVCMGSANAEIVDRISVIIDGHIIKHSDIIKDIRLTDLLNHETPTFNAGEQKKALARLIDQSLIRKELQAGLYSSPQPSEVDALLQQLKQSFGSEAAYRGALKSYLVSEEDLRQHLNWQLIVLRFINIRFASGAQIPDAEVRAYYQQHLPDFRRAGKPKLDLESLRAEIEQAIAGERVNQQFFAWLDESEKKMPVAYNEEALK